MEAIATEPARDVPSLHLRRRSVVAVPVARIPVPPGDPDAVGTRSVLATVLCTDVVDSTGHAVALGDARWLDVLAEHETMLRAEVRRSRGRPVVTVGDGMVALFDGAAAAIGCALRIAERSHAFGLEVRCGLHCGDTVRRGPRVGGIAFHVAARVLQHAAPGEVLVSEIAARLAAGSRLRFCKRGRRALRGLAGRWALYGVVEAAGAGAH